MTSQFQYLQLDFDSQQAALIQRTRSRFPGVWNDFYPGSLGRLFIDIGAWATTTLAYSINRLAAENYLSTMQLRESAVRFAAPFGYKLRGATPATVPCVATLASIALADVILAKGSPVRSGSQGLTFELVSDYTISTGELTPLAVVATFDPALVGARNVTALVSVTQNSPYVDCLDTATDLRQLVQVGQIFRVATAEPEYVVISIEIQPGSSSYNRLVVATNWTGTTAETTGEVIDRRIVFVQGQTQNERFNAPSNPASYVLKLAYSNLIDGSVQVAVNGLAWTEVPNLVLAEPTDEVFQVRTLPTGETIVAFGDDMFGASVPAQSTIGITYRTGGGTVGNIDSGLISSSITGLVSSLSNPVTITVTNRQPGTGGLEPESLSEARARIPAFIRTNDRAVTLEDYQTLATSYSSPAGQVRFARATVRTQNSLLEGNVVVLYAWTTGLENALVPCSTALKAALQQYLQTKAVGTDYVLIADGDATSFPMASRFKATPGYDVAAVEDDILATASKFVTALAPGTVAPYSQLVTTLAAVPGVIAITLAVPDQDVQTQPISDKTVFAPPEPRPFYAVEATSIGGASYTAQAPATQLVAWGITARLNGELLTITPDTKPGFARLTGTALTVGKNSTVNLQTGLIQFYTDGPVSTFEFGFISVQGYNRDRVVDIYAGYIGDTSLAKRREIRYALRAWASGIPVSAPLFADQVPGDPDSVVSAKAVIADVSGVIDVTKVSFDAPANTTSRLDVSEFELASVRNIFLNNQIDVIFIMLMPVGAALAALVNSINSVV